MKEGALHKLTKRSEAIGLLCNHTSWMSNEGRYSFDVLASKGVLKTIFIPEHGLFGELQDQVKFDDTSLYKPLVGKAQLVSLYSSSTKNLSPSADQLKDIDTFIIDIQDAGCRYYTYTTTIFLILKKITELGLDIKIIVFDKPNPAGRQVEGTRISKEYSSFIGLEGLPHRHGLTIAELCLYFKNKLQANWKLKVIPANSNYQFILPSPNMPSLKTCNIYSGQCLWEGTNASEGRGTTTPFEMAGAPFMDWVFADKWNTKKHPVYDKSCYIKPVRFIPAYHKHVNMICNGFHLLPLEKSAYHSLSHSLKLLRYCKERSWGLLWREGAYEAFNDKTAIELLVGDIILLDYLNGKCSWKEVREKLDEEERAWIKEAKQFLLLKTGLRKLNLN